jgi:hypothetical protein
MAKMYLTQTVVRNEVYDKLPKKGVILGKNASATTLEGKVCVAYVIRWFDEEFQTFRTAEFDVITGEYLGEIGDKNG